MREDWLRKRLRIKRRKEGRITGRLEGRLYIGEETVDRWVKEGKEESLENNKREGSGVGRSRGEGW